MSDMINWRWCGNCESECSVLSDGTPEAERRKDKRNGGAKNPHNSGATKAKASIKSTFVSESRHSTPHNTRSKE